MRHYFYLFTFLFLFSGPVFSQTLHQNSGWLMFVNSTKFSDKWGLALDMQLRSGDGWSEVRNTMFRPGISYYLDGKNEFTVGYLLNSTFTKTDGLANDLLHEHRIWEQYIHKHKISRTSVSHRLRLEQRFIDRANQHDLFSQRFRYFVRFIIPIEQGLQNFEKGIFLALQNELFFNIQNKNKLNGKLFDQNRAYVAGGYRFSKHFDIEAGYLNQAVNGLNNNTVNNVIQLALYTRF